MLLASKNGTISLADLVSETASEWLLLIEGTEVRVSKRSATERGFTDMVDALKWVGAEDSFIEYFKTLVPARALPGDHLHA